MLSPPVLTAQQVAAFAATGCLVVRTGFDAGAVREVGRWCDELLALPEEPGKHWVFHEKSLLDPGRDLVSRIEYIAPFHNGFAVLAEALRAPVGQLLGEAALLFKEKVNFKMPGGEGFKAHQDAQAGWTAYASFFVTAALCIDEATEQNGCLQLAAGQHKRGLSRLWEPLGEEEMRGMEFRPCPTAPGDLVFLDSYAPHVSQPNLSDGMRRFYFATYNRRSEGDHLARYYADKRKSYPPDIEREPGKTYVFRV